MKKPTKQEYEEACNNIDFCKNTIRLTRQEIDKKLDVGTNKIEFTPQEEGEYIYSCWMNMIKNKIKVIDNKDYFKEEN